MKKRILFIEDEIDLARLVGFRLEEEGYEVSVAYDGQEGLAKAQEGHPDLILLDLMLPKMNGYKICALLKSDPAYSKIPIIIFTARAQQADRNMSKKVGADAYITKPFEADELINAIEKLLKGKGE